MAWLDDDDDDDDAEEFLSRGSWFKGRQRRSRQLSRRSSSSLHFRDDERLALAHRSALDYRHYIPHLTCVVWVVHMVLLAGLDAFFVLFVRRNPCHLYCNCLVVGGANHFPLNLLHCSDLQWRQRGGSHDQ